MSTSCQISVYHLDSDSWQSIIVKNGGDEVGQLLIAHYNSHPLAESVVGLGDLSRLECSMDKPHSHTFVTPVPGYSVAYHRDRGDKWCDCKARLDFDCPRDRRNAAPYCHRSGQRTSRNRRPSSGKRRVVTALADAETTSHRIQKLRAFLEAATREPATSSSPALALRGAAQSLCNNH